MVLSPQFFIFILIHHITVIISILNFLHRALSLPLISLCQLFPTDHLIDIKIQKFDQLTVNRHPFRSIDLLFLIHLPTSTQNLLAITGNNMPHPVFIHLIVTNKELNHISQCFESRRLLLLKWLVHIYSFQFVRFVFVLSGWLCGFYKGHQIRSERRVLDKT